MIGYVTLGSNDIPRAAAFYDELLKLLGASRFMESDTMIAWGVSPDKPALGVIKPFDGKPASAGNGVMVSLDRRQQRQGRRTACEGHGTRRQRRRRAGSAGHERILRGLFPRPRRPQDQLLLLESGLRHPAGSAPDDAAFVRLRTGRCRARRGAGSPARASAPPDRPRPRSSMHCHRPARRSTLRATLPTAAARRQRHPWRCARRSSCLTARGCSDSATWRTHSATLQLWPHATNRRGAGTARPRWPFPATTTTCTVRPTTFSSILRSSRRKPAASSRTPARWRTVGE